MVRLRGDIAGAKRGSRPPSLGWLPEDRPLLCINFSLLVKEDQELWEDPDSLNLCWDQKSHCVSPKL